MEQPNPWDLPSTSAAPATPASPGSSFKLNSRHVKNGLGIGGLALLAGLGIAYRGEIAETMRGGISSVTSGVRRASHTGSVIPETSNNAERVRAIEQDIVAADALEARMGAYMNQHPNYAQEAAFTQMLAQRRTGAESILSSAVLALGKPDNEEWGNYVESLWGTSKAGLLTVRLLYGIGLSLHRLANNGDANDNQGARVIYNMFSQDGWQGDTGLVSDRRDPNNIHYGMLATLQRANLASFSVAKRQASTPGSMELVAEPAYLAAIRTRVQRIKQVIEAKRTAGQLTRANVATELNSTALPADALVEVPMVITLAAVYPRLNAAGSTVDNEVIRLALLGGRPYMTVLPVSDGQGGGVTRARELDPSEIPDPSTFVVVSR